MKADTLLLGTDKGDLFEVSIQGDKILSVTSLGHSITAVDINDDCSLAAAGSNSGSLLVKSSK